MNTYTTPRGLTIGMDSAPLYTRDLYADLVAAIHIAHAFEAKCVRLEAELARIKAELDRLELVS